MTPFIAAPLLAICDALCARVMTLSSMEPHELASLEQALRVLAEQAEKLEGCAVTQQAIEAFNRVMEDAK